VRALKAGPLLAAGLCNARATVEYLASHVQGRITLLATGVLPGEDGDEDIACAELIAANLRGKPVDLPALLERVRISTWGQNFTDPAHPEFPLADLELAVQVDRFAFAMPVQREGEHLVMRAERI
jgi:2-phosphosulfolactate phosphatase